jgi:oleandomycin transport system ATP-binding protein
VIAAGTPQQLKTRVGGQVLQARPSDPADLPEVEKVLAAFVEDGEAPYNDGQQVAVTVKDRDALGMAFRRLDETGIAVDDLAIRRPSLDEVFLTITGHLAEDDEEELDDASDRRPA